MQSVPSRPRSACCCRDRRRSASHHPRRAHSYLQIALQQAHRVIGNQQIVQVTVSLGEGEGEHSYVTHYSMCWATYSSYESTSSLVLVDEVVGEGDSLGLEAD